MRHQKNTLKFGHTQGYRDALIANQAVSLIEHNRIKTTLAKAKAVRPFAEKLITLGKRNTLHSRRTALAYLRHNEDAVRKLFGEVAPRCATRNGGYTRIVKLGPRRSDSAPMAFLEWVDAPVVEETIPEPAPAKAKKARPETEAPEAAESEPKAEKPKRASRKKEKSEE